MFVDDSVVNLPRIAAADVPTPSANRFALFFEATNGHLCQMDSSRVVIDLTANNVSLNEPTNEEVYLPAQGATGTGTGYGGTWTPNGTVSHIVPAFTGRAASLYKTRFANAAAANSLMGVIAGGGRFAAGNVAGVGGFYFKARFNLDLIPAGTVRIFAGLCETSPASTDAPSGNFIGLWHDTTDDLSTLSWLSGNGTATTKAPFTLSTAMANNRSFELEILCQPAASTISCTLKDFTGNNAVLSSQSITDTLPNPVVNLTPVVNMSNGTANTTANTVAVGINFIGCRTVN
jgi:hypothetical protein